MAFLGQAFNVNELPESENNFTPLPAGIYQAIVTAAEIKTTNAGTGQYIKVEYEISGPTGAGRKVWQNFNIRNANPKAEEIGRRQLGELMKASGLNTVEDTDQLMTGRIVELKLTVRKSEEYGDQNEVKAIKALANAMPHAQQMQPAPVQQGTIPVSAAPAANSPPWAK